MNEIKAKTSVTKSVRQEIIDKFMISINKHKEHLESFKNNNSPVILFIASTSDTTNKNGRIIDGEFVEENLENYIGSPVKFDHDSSQGSVVGNIFSGFIIEDKGKKFTCLAAVVDNIGKMTRATLTKYSRYNFSASYAPLGSDTICPSCKQNTTKFLNIYTKELECNNCTHSFGKEYDVNKLDVKPHARIYERDKDEGRIYGTWDNDLLKKSHKFKDLKKKGENDKNAYFMVIQKHKIAEISFVESPADALDAPLIAFSTTSDLLKTLNPQDNFGSFVHPLNKVEYDTDTIEDTLKLNEFKFSDDDLLNNKNIGESKKMHKSILDLLTTLGTKHPEYTDEVITNLLKEEDGVKQLDELVTDALAVKYINNIINKTFNKNSELTKELDELKKVLSKKNDTEETSTDELNDKADKADTEQSQDGDDSSIFIKNPSSKTEKKNKKRQF